MMGSRGSLPSPIAMLLLATIGLAACGQEEAEAPAMVPRPVRAFTVEAPAQQASTRFTGRIEAKDDVSLGFRISGRLSERLVGVGATVREGDVVARLEPQNELNALRSARAALAAAQGVLTQAENTLQRQRHLLERAVTTQADFEAAEQSATAARSQVEASQAQLRIAEDAVGFTTLEADAPGVVTAVGA